jgi:hypothetical protein
MVWGAFCRLFPLALLDALPSTAGWRIAIHEIAGTSIRAKRRSETYANVDCRSFCSHQASASKKGQLQSKRHGTSPTVQARHVLQSASLHVRERPRTKLLGVDDNLSADHATVGDYADPTDCQALSQAIDHREQRGHNGGVARSHFRAYRPAILIRDDASSASGATGSPWSCRSDKRYAGSLLLSAACSRRAVQCLLDWFRTAQFV